MNIFISIVGCAFCVVLFATLLVWALACFMSAIRLIVKAWKETRALWRK